MLGSCSRAGADGGDTVSVSGCGNAVKMEGGAPVQEVRSEWMCLLAERLRLTDVFSLMKSSHIL